MKFLSILIFTIIFNPRVPAMVDQTTANYILFLRNQLRIEYKSIDKNFSEIIEDNLPYAENISETSNREITYYLHGFMGTPHEMKYIAEGALKKGHTVFNDLIIGYGGTTYIANKIKKEMYVSHVEKNLDFIFKNYDRVNLVGFSTGGLLISNYLNTHPEMHKKVGKIQLVSPFYFSHISFAPAFSKFARIFAPEVSIPFFYKYTSFPDVEIMTLEPSNYLMSVPAYAAGEIADLAYDYVKNAKILSNLNNIEIYLTKKDQVLSFDKTKTFLTNTFPNAKFFLFDQGMAPHHLMAPTVSNIAIQIKNNL